MSDEHDCNQKEEFQKLSRKVGEVFDANAGLHLSQQELHLSHKAIDSKVDAVLESLTKMADMQREAMLSDNSHKKDIEQIKQMLDDFKVNVEKINNIQFGKHTDAHQRIDEIEKFVTVYNELKVKDHVGTLMNDRSATEGAKKGIKAWKAEIYMFLTIAIMLVGFLWGKIQIIKPVVGDN